MVYGLEQAEENTIDKLNTVTDMVTEMSRGYRNVSEDLEKEETKKENFIYLFEEKIEDLKENILYDDLKDEDNGLIDSIFKELETENSITKEKIIKLLECRNEYILGFDDFDTNMKIEGEIEEVVKIINDTYKITMLNNLWKQRIKQNKKVMSNQLDGVSRAITDVANTLHKSKEEVKESVKEEKKVKEDRYKISIGIAEERKSGTTVSGDSNIGIRLDDGKYLVALSDGMGSGQDARKASKTAIKMLSRMLSTGFNKDTSLELINSSLYINSKEDSFATLDIAIFDLYKGNMEFMKNGACPTFIKNKREVNVVKSVSLPTGILDEVDLVVYDKDLKDKDIIIMCTDGVLESAEEYENKELWIKNLLEEIDTDKPKRIADILLAQAKENDGGVLKDDMTVIAVKIENI